MKEFFPYLMIAESIIAGAIYVFARDWNKAGYFLCGAAITWFALRMH
jgi:hypothetical protein